MSNIIIISINNLNLNPWSFYFKKFPCSIFKQSQQEFCKQTKEEALKVQCLPCKPQIGKYWCIGPGGRNCSESQATHTKIILSICFYIVKICFGQAQKSGHCKDAIVMRNLGPRSTGYSNLFYFFFSSVLPSAAPTKARPLWDTRTSSVSDISNQIGFIG